MRGYSIKPAKTAFLFQLIKTEFCTTEVSLKQNCVGLSQYTLAPPLEITTNNNRSDWRATPRTLTSIFAIIYFRTENGNAQKNFVTQKV